MQLYPDIAPLFVKFGFTKDPEQRMLNHRSERSAPAGRMLKVWPAIRMWERYIIKHVTVGYRRVMETELYLVDDVGESLERVDAFVAANDVMKIATPPPEPPYRPRSELLPIARASWRFRVSEATIQLLIASGKVTAYPISVTYYLRGPCVDEDELDACLNGAPLL